MIARDEIWWAKMPEPVGSAPGHRRPVLVIQSDIFNRSRLATVTVIVLTGSIRLVDAPGNVLIPAEASGLPRDSVANVTQLLTVHREFLTARVGELPAPLVRQVNAGLRFVLEL